ncbi:MAG: LysM peptidoglycan-binding domain-containing protein [Oxalobacter sp.]|nr:MAG: LysM peptidoglycan-binding domain-containing protein [Oxalobacter sp.]
MKKFSTATLILALLATTTFQASAEEKKKCALRKDAPDKHVVVKGNTLWGISSLFLERPWCWPEVWGMNREQIRNPHWIFPGQIIYLDHATGKLRLASPTGDTTKVPYVATAEPLKAPTDARLKPAARITPMSQEALPSIDPRVIEPFLSQALIVDEDALENAPRIVGSMEGRVKLGEGDRAYVRGNLKEHGVFNVFEPVRELKDPETKKTIAYEAVHLGTVELTRKAANEREAHAFIVREANKEMGVGDRLITKPPHAVMNYVPHPPEKPIDARVLSIYSGVTHAGQGQVVSLNRGQTNGLNVGTVLKLYRLGETISDKTSTSWFSSSKVKLPDEESGTAFVFRVFKDVSYALIMEAKDVVEVGDAARSPE